jgi:hypothetical protein
MNREQAQRTVVVFRECLQIIEGSSHFTYRKTSPFSPEEEDTRCLIPPRLAATPKSLSSR